MGRARTKPAGHGTKAHPRRLRAWRSVRRVKEAVRRQFAYPPRTAVAAVPTTLAGLTVAALALAHGGWRFSLPLLGLLAAATLAEAFPVPIEGVAAGTTSFSTVFIAATASEYGWARASIVGGLAIGLAELPKRLLGRTIAYNIGLFALAGAAAGAIRTCFPMRPGSASRAHAPSTLWMSPCSPGSSAATAAMPIRR